MAPPNRLEINRLWYHGTTHGFEKWTPPPLAVLPQVLVPHSFVSLSADLKYAIYHKGPHGGICSAELASTTRILDLRIKTHDSLLLWESVKSTRLGSKYYGLSTPNEWHASCQAGSVLRFIFASAKDDPELFAQQEIAKNTSIDHHSRSKAAVYIQNFTRQWIETVISPAKDMGYDAVICNELERTIDSTASTQLFVFDVHCLSQPNWIISPSRNQVSS